MTMMLEMIVCCFHITSFIELLPQWMWIIQNWHDCCWWIGWAVLTIAVSIVTICFVVSYTLQLTFSFMSCTFHKKLFNYQPVVSKSPPPSKNGLGPNFMQLYIFQWFNSISYQNLATKYEYQSDEGFFAKYSVKGHVCFVFSVGCVCVWSY